MAIALKRSRLSTVTWVSSLIGSLGSINCGGAVGRGLVFSCCGASLLAWRAAEGESSDISPMCCIISGMAASRISRSDAGMSHSLAGVLSAGYDTLVSCRQAP